jgi:hypothetical protein
MLDIASPSRTAVGQCEKSARHRLASSLSPSNRIIAGHPLTTPMEYDPAFFGGWIIKDRVVLAFSLWVEPYF